MSNGQLLIEANEVISDGAATAAVAWSLRHSGDPLGIRVTGGVGDADLIGFDIRVELMTDPAGYEVTRGLQLAIDEYETLGAEPAAAAVELRSRFTRELLDTVIDAAYRHALLER